MNKKINAICFILLFFLMICSVSAADNDNETQTTLTQSIDSDICSVSVSNTDEKLEVSNIENEKLSAASPTKEKVTLKAPDVKMYYKDGHKFTATLKDSKKKAIQKAKIKITLNGKTYEKTTDKNGAVSLDLNLKSGIYTVLSAFAGTNAYNQESVKSTVTVKSTIKNSDFTKYYKNTAAYYSTFYDSKGKLLKNSEAKFKVNGKTYSVKTNSNGVAKLSIDLKPGKYSIVSTNTKTSESVTKTITVKSLIETKDVTVNEGTSAKFSVKILNSNGKASPNKKVTLKVNGKSYTKTTDKNGLASLSVELDAGKYTITTEYSGLKASNKITVNKVIKTSKFTHSIIIPSYVNVTTPYVYQNTAYALKTGVNGIIQMPKQEIVTVQVADKSYVFSNLRISGVTSTVIGYQYHFIPFDGSGIKSDTNRNNLKGDGIIISETSRSIQIDYQSTTKDNVEMFGWYADKGLEDSEVITYVQNEKVKAKVGFKTVGFDELGLRYNIAKFYGKYLYDFSYKSYDQMTNNEASAIKFALTNTTVSFSFFGNSILGQIPKEIIKTKFIINGKEELEKTETISYGLGEKYRSTIGFEVLQSYAIVTEKVKQKTLKNWLSKNSTYRSKSELINVYGMFLSSLETLCLADEVADKYAKDFNVKWSRGKTATVMGGINLDDTYLHILNADMGMTVSGSEATNVIAFKMLNSLYLPNIESYTLSPISERYGNNASNSLESVFSKIFNGKFSFSEMNGQIYIFSEDKSQSAIIINNTSGVSNVITNNNGNIYKGSSIQTRCDCCSVKMIPYDVMKGVTKALKLISPGISVFMDNMDKLYPTTILIHKTLAAMLSKKVLVATGSKGAALSIFTSMVLLQEGGTYVRDKMVDKKNWHTAMDVATFTRPGYLQGKKVYNIPNKKGGYDYVEVKIKDDFKLDRNSAVYISNGKTKTLTKKETYQYFSDEYWTPFSMPTKYWDSSWKGVAK